MTHFVTSEAFMAACDTYHMAPAEETNAHACARHFESRGRFFVASVIGAVESVYNVAMTVLKSAVATLFLFCDQEINCEAWNAFKDSAESLTGVLLSVVGTVVWPGLAVLIDAKLGELVDHHENQANQERVRQLSAG